MKHPRITHRTPSPQIISAVQSPDSGFILWELDGTGTWRERARSIYGSHFVDLSEWTAGALLRTFCGCTGERIEST